MLSARKMIQQLHYSDRLGGEDERDNSEMKSTMTPVGADPGANHRDENRWRCSLQRHGWSVARAK